MVEEIKTASVSHAKRPPRQRLGPNAAAFMDAQLSYQLTLGDNAGTNLVETRTVLLVGTFRYKNWKIAEEATGLPLSGRPPRL